ncbi:MAG TPA: hypothetical protein VFW55_06395 [Propionicimonas sp.]|nr:hypothetical protein [Propionicimonas sp.]
MIVGVRRALTGLAVGVVVSLGVAPVLPAYADTPSPTPVAASATPSASTGADIDAGDVAPDNSRQAWVLGGAGVLALIAAAVVFLRRR